MHLALQAASDALSRFLALAIDADPTLGPLFVLGGGPMVVTLNTPREMLDLPAQGLSVWLYQVLRDDQRLNAPPERVRVDQVRPAPLPLRLRYLVSPVVSQVANSPNASPRREQEILGRVLQALHDHPILRGADLEDTAFEGTNVTLNVRLEPVTVEEITRVWHALQQSYQLSVSYEMSLVFIDTALSVSPAHPVRVALPEYGIVVREEV